MPEILFVYGTLRSEFDNVHARRLRASAKFHGPAAVRGSVINLGPYPGYKPEGSQEVTGELWLLNNASGILAALDEYEGSEFERVATQTIAGDPVWIYQLV